MLTFTLVLFALAGLFLASPAKNAFKFVYMDKSGIHYSADAPRYLNISTWIFSDFCDGHQPCLCLKPDATKMAIGESRCQSQSQRVIKAVGISNTTTNLSNTTVITTTTILSSRSSSKRKQRGSARPSLTSSLMRLPPPSSRQ